MRRFTVDDITTPINLLHELRPRRLRRAPACRVATLHAAMAKNQLRRTQTRRDQFPQPQGCRRETPRELRHEGHARLLNGRSNVLVFDRIEIQVTGPVDRLARFRGGEHRQPAEPGALEHHHRIDVAARNESPIAIHRVGLEFVGRVLRQLGHRAEYGSHIESIVQHPQGGAVTRLPRVAEPDKSDPQFHGVSQEKRASTATHSHANARRNVVRWFIFAISSQSGAAICRTRLACPNS